MSITDDPTLPPEAPMPPPEPVAGPESALPSEAAPAAPEPANGTETPPAPVTPLDLGAQHDALYTAMVESDKLVRKYRNKIAAHNNAIRQETHERHLTQVTLKSHCDYLRQLATTQIRAAAGLTKINGARLPAETLTSYKARMSAANKLHAAQVNAELAKIDNPPKP